jgi:hypothetical protein
MSKRNFVAFILTHGRADNVKTVKSLERAGYTGKILFIVDNEDAQAEKYRQNFGAENVIVFDKKAIAKTFDMCDNFGKRNSITCARNICFEIAKERGITHFVELDDDYTEFSWNFDKEFKYKNHVWITDLDKVINIILDFLDFTPTLSIALSQGGDVIGGGLGRMMNTVGISRGAKRKAMNSFFCRTDRQVGFLGLMNEDVNTYVTKGTRGDLFFTVNLARLEQGETQKTDGGISELYRSFGTYVKSFYTVMQAPSCVKLRMLNTSSPRLHHRIIWDAVTPKILSPEYKKAVSNGN